MKMLLQNMSMRKMENLRQLSGQKGLHHQKWVDKTVILKKKLPMLEM